MNDPNLEKKVVTVMCGARLRGCKYEDMCGRCTAPEERKKKCEDVLVVTK